jgi:hypothetical protein
MTACISKEIIMKRVVLISLAVLSCVCLASSAYPHHAMEYIEIESYDTAKHGEFVSHFHYDYMVDDANNPKADHWEFTPGIAYGLTHRLMCDVHTHFAKFGEDHVVADKRADYAVTGTSPFMEAAAISVQYRLTENRPVDFGLSGTIEIPFSRAKDLLGSENNVYQGLLIVSRGFGTHANVCVNISYEQEGDENSAAWAFGLKNPISADPHGIAAGVEAMGNFEGTSWSILPGVYAPIGDGIVFKTGLQFGQEEDEEGNTADTMRAGVSLMYRF